MVSIREISITSNIFKNLIRAYTEPRFMEYLQTKHRLSDSTIESIAWKSLSLAIYSISRNVLLMKICNNILPTFYQLHRFGMHSTKMWKICNNILPIFYQVHRFGMHSKNKCPLCKIEETLEHMIQYIHSSQIPWKCGLIKKTQN